MTIRSKFECTSVEKQKGWEGHEFVYTAKFQAVRTGSEENRRFWAATPGGSVTLCSIRPDAFAPGRCYYLDFTPTDGE